MNCLSYALRFWDKNPTYNLYYNSNHIINSSEHISGSDYIEAKRFGYEYFASAFDNLITKKDKKLLKKYFNIK